MTGTFDSKLARAGLCSDKAHGAIMPPLYLASNYEFSTFGQKPAYEYSRAGNPTRACFEDALAAAEGGRSAIATASGMAAIDLVLSLLSPDDVIIAPDDCYGGTCRLLNWRAQKGHFKVIFAPLHDTQKMQSLFAQNPKMVFIETPSNPLLRLTDLDAIIPAAHRAGAVCVVDNTFLSPAMQQPIKYGADIVLHSTTKLINGHADMVGGAVICASEETGTHLRWVANCTGCTGGAFDAWLALRGLRTLPLRARAQSQTALQIANALTGHTAVQNVYYPGLKTHPNHALAARQQSGFGQIVSFTLKGGQDAAQRFCAASDLFILAESLGGIESLVAHPATMTHAAMDAAALRKAGISPSLLRLSIGVESAQDLLTDLDSALDAAHET